jgi:hypothetical protein
MQQGGIHNGFGTILGVGVGEGVGAILTMGEYSLSR